MNGDEANINSSLDDWAPSSFPAGKHQHLSNKFSNLNEKKAEKCKIIETGL